METVREFLARRKRELTHQLTAQRSEVTVTEAELAAVDAAMAALPPLYPWESHSGGAVALESTSRIAVTAAANIGASNSLTAHATVLPGPNYGEMTIKQLAVRGLETNYPNGTTMMDLRDFIKNAYGRAIEPSSLRPQMHRLKADGVLTHDARTDTWNLTPEKRRDYSMYDHPSSQKARRELQDDEIPPNEPTTRLREMEEPNTPPKGFGPLKRNKDPLFDD
jgi:hypothetical protein